MKLNEWLKVQGSFFVSKNNLKLSSDKKIAGVAAGVAEFLEVDATLVRLVWLVLTVLTGVIPGTVLYLLLWWLLPRK